MAAQMEEDIFNCVVDRMEYPIDEVRMLSCHHTVCTECLKRTVMEAIKARDTLTKLRCPMNFCPGRIDRFMIMGNCPELFDEYSDAVSGKALIDAMTDEEILLYCQYSICPTVDCSFRSLVKKTQEKTTCRQCNKSYCPQCKQPPHQGRTCDEALEASRGSRKPMYCVCRDRETVEQMNAKCGEKKFALCPKCGAMCEKKKGCSLVDCDSPFCQETTSFCVKCLQIVRTRHMIHHCGVPDPDYMQIPGPPIFDMLRRVG